MIESYPSSSPYINSQLERWVPNQNKPGNLSHVVVEIKRIALTMHLGEGLNWRLGMELKSAKP